MSHLRQRVAVIEDAPHTPDVFGASSIRFLTELDSVAYELYGVSIYLAI
jgi:hypothetical protein